MDIEKIATLDDVEYIRAQVDAAQERRNQRIRQAAEDYQRIVADIEHDFTLELAAVRTRPRAPRQ